MSLFSVSRAIAAWYNEVRFYEFRTRKCNHVCGHYTQVVWADSYKVGCAVQFCPQVSGISYSNVAHFVCNYGPAGNYPTWPYEKGRSCSACQKNDKCLYNLCVNQQRDQVTGYFTNEFPGRPVYFRNKYLSLFLIVSPLIIILSVIVIIWVKHKNPNIVPVG
ncbi:glioma pathogenesis-related protein 1 [Erinaceus europaeus]|uniref:Glioma pathogenesis-related protein 1 n=1 Tax=Erinaceus europaeus TaxID=9365 RepID=A0ABM3XQ15_ERIEU|nr:glioma pathogenesis-related protein 1 [Erinaceus europaeus]